MIHEGNDQTSRMKLIPRCCPREELRKNCGDMIQGMYIRFSLLLKFSLGKELLLKITNVALNNGPVLELFV